MVLFCFSVGAGKHLPPLGTRWLLPVTVSLWPPVTAWLRLTVTAVGQHIWFHKAYGFFRLSIHLTLFRLWSHVSSLHSRRTSPCQRSTCNTIRCHFQCRHLCFWLFFCFFQSAFPIVLISSFLGGEITTQRQLHFTFIY